MTVKCACLKLHVHVCAYIPGQQCLLQGSCLKSAPVQGLPPFRGLGSSHVLSNLCTPPTPQYSEQSPDAYHSPQPPSTIVAVMRNLLIIIVCFYTDKGHIEEACPARLQRELPKVTCQHAICTASQMVHGIRQCSSLQIPTIMPTFAIVTCIFFIPNQTVALIAAFSVDAA